MSLNYRSLMLRAQKVDARLNEDLNKLQILGDRATYEEISDAYFDGLELLFAHLLTISMSTIRAQTVILPLNLGQTAISDCFGTDEQFQQVLVDLYQQLSASDVYSIEEKNSKYQTRLEKLITTYKEQVLNEKKENDQLVLKLWWK